MASKRKIFETAVINGKQAIAYYDSEWLEYRVRLYENGQLNKKADYFTTDKEDAICSANAMVLR